MGAAEVTNQLGGASTARKRSLSIYGLDSPVFFAQKLCTGSHRNGGRSFNARSINY
jgi:hypothetical protein